MRRASLLIFAAASIVAGCDDCNKPATSTADGAASNADASSAGDGGVLNATPAPTASVAAAVNPQNLPAYHGPTGSVEGTVTVTGDPPAREALDFSRCPDAAKAWGTDFRESPGPNGARMLADAVVAVTGYTGFYLPEKNESKLVTIEGCAYKDLTVTMTYGQRLEVKNDTGEFWTPVLEPSPHLVMMMAPPRGDAVRIYPKKPGHYVLTDRDRKYVFVDVYAFLHPLHTATDTQGHYRIDGLPVGKVKVNARHPRFEGETTVDLEVREGVVAKVDLVLKHDQGDAGAKTLDAGYHPILR